ncbi:MAG TPA: hypothetical protein VHE55_15965 [Fimbriimonadaceae bacterium]|nr:hypothetical protein [Fimbriimonadaceae bacterium]
MAGPAAGADQLSPGVEASVFLAGLGAFMRDLEAREVISPLAAVKPEVTYAFAAALKNKAFGDLPKAKRRLLARIGRCRYSCEVYLEAKAWLSEKKLVYVDGGVPVGPVPVE